MQTFHLNKNLGRGGKFPFSENTAGNAGRPILHYLIMLDYYELETQLTEKTCIDGSRVLMKSGDARKCMLNRWCKYRGILLCGAGANQKHRASAENTRKTEIRSCLSFFYYKGQGWTWGSHTLYTYICPPHIPSVLGRQHTDKCPQIVANVTRVMAFVWSHQKLSMAPRARSSITQSPGCVHAWHEGRVAMEGGGAL